MDFITVISESCQKDEGHKRTSSLGISEKRPHVLAIVGVLPHGSDVFMDKANTECLIEYLEEELQTMEKYNCTECGSYESNLPKCDKCQKVETPEG